MIKLNIENRLGLSREIVYRESPQRGHLVMVNAEGSINEQKEEDTIQNRCWAHLGLPTIAATAKKAGYKVVQHDELLQGYANLKELITPGCIFGLSLVVTGIDRGIELAREAKRLGAKYVIAGNDAAIFRAQQLLSLPDTPIDAVFTNSELRPIRTFLKEIQTKDLKDISIPGVAFAAPTENRSNVLAVMRTEKEKRKQIALMKSEEQTPDFFEIPEFDPATLEIAARNYRINFERQHERPENVRPALVHFAQGCTRTGTGEVCEYCTIADVGVVSLAKKAYLRKLLEAYEKQGINYVFNVTDSSFGMEHLLRDLEDLGAYFSEGLVMYARAHEIAKKPELISRWQKLAGGRGVVFNVGMDSGSERMLRNVNKASKIGSRLAENWEAIKKIKQYGAHGHFSVIFGIPGEDRKTCEETMKFVREVSEYMGGQMSQFESDIFWLNFGSPASEVFTSFKKAQEYASRAGKRISKAEWRRDFYAHRNELSVPKSAQDAWYRYFTNISREDADAYVAEVNKIMKMHATAAPPRSFNFRPPTREE